MTDSRAATGYDRLPWLKDDEPLSLRTVKVDPARWAIAALIAIGAVAALIAVAAVVALIYYRGASEADSVRAAPQVESSATVPLPSGKSADAPTGPATLVEPPSTPTVEPAPAPAMPEYASRDSIRPTTASRTFRPPAPSASMTDSEATPAIDGDEVKPAVPAIPDPWPVRVHDGASGRLVRIGAFTTAHQAKKGWRAIMKINPTLEHLPALVVPIQSARNGRTYFRLQMGTTSQAHSTVLCQKMRMIGQSCVVIDIDNRGEAVEAS